MGYFGGKHREDNFFLFVATALITQAPNQKERDDLQEVIDFAFTRRLGAGHAIDGKNIEPKKLEDMLELEHGWIVEVIINCQQTWELTEGTLPVDLLKAESSGKLLDLEHAISSIERQHYYSAAEKK